MASNVSIPAGAMAAALAAAGKHDPNEGDPSAGGSPQGSPQGGDPSQTQTADPNAPTDPTADPNAQGQDPNQQAVWQEFPATDPQNVEALVQQMQGADPEKLVQLFSQFMQQVDADNDKLTQMHESMVQHLMELFGGPGGDGGQSADMPSGASPVPVGPGVGGAGSGY